MLLLSFQVLVGLERNRCGRLKDRASWTFVDGQHDIIEIDEFDKTTRKKEKKKDCRRVYVAYSSITCTVMQYERSTVNT